MRGIILAAGRGSRMGKLTHNKPKCLSEINGSSLLDLQIKSLKDGGVSEIALVTGYRRDMLTRPGIVEFYNRDWATTQMVYSLMQAKDWLATAPCIVSYSDIFFDAHLVSKLIESKAKLGVAYDSNWFSLWSRRFSDPSCDAEDFEIDPIGNLVSIGGRPARPLKQIVGQYMGLLRFTPEGWSEVENVLLTCAKKVIAEIHMTSLLQLIIERGRMKIGTVENDQPWGEVDQASDLALYDLPTFKTQRS